MFDKSYYLIAYLIFNRTIVKSVPLCTISKARYESQRNDSLMKAHVIRAFAVPCPLLEKWQSSTVGLPQIALPPSAHLVVAPQCVSNLWNIFSCRIGNSTTGIYISLNKMYLSRNVFISMQNMTSIVTTGNYNVILFSRVYNFHYSR